MGDGGHRARGPLVRAVAPRRPGQHRDLRHTAAIGAYTLVDSATLIMACPEGYTGLFRGDPALVNQFNLIPVNPELFPPSTAQPPSASWPGPPVPAGQAVVRAFGAESYGEPLFRTP